ncbi:MAG: PepSY domain-containing protein [Paracoccus sp. (in: a-proteobacteria)]|nr:PepSY domain-containing protein [Paracoccus sp. (in: a-proteobacteria)]
MRILILTVALIASPLLALARDDACKAMVDPTVALGRTGEEVAASLTATGFEVRKTDTEDGEIEVYDVKNKVMAEIYVSPETGLPTKVKFED